MVNRTGNVGNKVQEKHKVHHVRTRERGEKKAKEKKKQIKRGKVKKALLVQKKEKSAPQKLNHLVTPDSAPLVPSDAFAESLDGVRKFAA